MEMTLRGNLETRVAVLEESVKERAKDIDEIKTKLDRLVTTGFWFIIALLADIVLDKTGLLSAVGHHLGG